MPKIRMLTGAKAIERQKLVEAGHVRVRIPPDFVSTVGGAGGFDQNFDWPE